MRFKNSRIRTVFLSVLVALIAFTGSFFASRLYLPFLQRFSAAGGWIGGVAVFTLVLIVMYWKRRAYRAERLDRGGGGEHALPK